MPSLRRWRFEDTSLLLISILCVSYSAEGFSLFNQMRSQNIRRTADAATEELIEDTRPVVPYTRWTDYGLWGPCSRTCGSGIQVRTRSCFHRFSNEYLPDTDCVGDLRQIRLCKIQDCPAGVPSDHREEECSQLSTPQMKWKPLYLREGWYYITRQGGVTSAGYGRTTYCTNPAMSPCWLGCYSSQAVSWRIVAQEVPDGTPCASRAGSGVCIDNECLIYGCDGLVGSSKVKDICGVCDGDGSSCDVVASSKIVNHLQVGYNEALDIPAGAINIRVLEVRGGKNYLALREKDGPFVINGNYRIDNSRLFVASGSLCSYQRREVRVAKTGMSHTEMFTCAGPVNDSLTVMVLTRDRSPSYLAYEYALPLAQAPTTPSAYIPPTTQMAFLEVDKDTGEESKDISGEIISGTIQRTTVLPGSEYTLTMTDQRVEKYENGDKGEHKVSAGSSSRTFDSSSSHVDVTRSEMNDEESWTSIADNVYPSPSPTLHVVVTGPEAVHQHLDHTTPSGVEEEDNLHSSGQSVLGTSQPGVPGGMLQGGGVEVTEASKGSFTGITHLADVNSSTIEGFGRENSGGESPFEESPKSISTLPNTSGPSVTILEDANIAGNSPTYRKGQLEAGKAYPFTNAPSGSGGVLSITGSLGPNSEGGFIPGGTSDSYPTLQEGDSDSKIVVGKNGGENMGMVSMDSDLVIGRPTHPVPELRIDSVTLNPSTAEPRPDTNILSAEKILGENKIDVQFTQSEGLIPSEPAREIVPSTAQLKMNEGPFTPPSQPGIGGVLASGEEAQSRVIGKGIPDATQSMEIEDIVPMITQPAMDDDITASSAHLEDENVAPGISSGMKKDIPVTTLPRVLNNSVVGIPTQSSLKNDIVTVTMNGGTNDDHEFSTIPSGRDKGMLPIVTGSSGKGNVIEGAVTHSVTEKTTNIQTSLDELPPDFSETPTEGPSSLLSYEWFVWDYPDTIPGAGSDLELKSVGLGDREHDIDGVAPVTHPVVEEPELLTTPSKFPGRNMEGDPTVEMRGADNRPTFLAPGEEVGELETVTAADGSVPPVKILSMVEEIGDTSQSRPAEDSRNELGLGLVTESLEVRDNGSVVPQLRFESRGEGMVDHPVALGASFAELVDPRYANLNISNEISSKAGNSSSQGRLDSDLLDQNWIPDFAVPSAVPRGLPDEEGEPDDHGQPKQLSTLEPMLAETTSKRSRPQRSTGQPPERKTTPQEGSAGGLGASLPGVAPARAESESVNVDTGEGAGMADDEGEPGQPSTLESVFQETTTRKTSTGRPPQHAATLQMVSTRKLGVSPSDMVTSTAESDGGSLQGAEGPLGNLSLTTGEEEGMEQHPEIIRMQDVTPMAAATPTEEIVLGNGGGTGGTIAGGSQKPYTTSVGDTRPDKATSASPIDPIKASHLTTHNATLSSHEGLSTSEKNQVQPITASALTNFATERADAMMTNSTSTASMTTSTIAPVAMTQSTSDVANIPPNVTETRVATTTMNPTTKAATTHVTTIAADSTTASPVATTTPLATTAKPVAMTTTSVATMTSEMPVATTTPVLTTTPIRVTTILPTTTEGNEIVPVTERPDFVWRRTATSCQVTCGRGIQRDYIYCANRDDIEVADRFCNPQTKPDPIPRSCVGQRCEPRWEVGAWSSCSVTCGGGRQFRTVSCWRMEAKGMDAMTMASSCVAASGRELPEVQDCATQPCFARWRVGQWSSCSAQCGEGQKTRTVLCSGTGGNRCDPATRPPDTQTCEDHRCQSNWATHDWPQCNGACQTQMRRVNCYSPSQLIQADNNCSHSRKPLSVRLCGPWDCTPRWIAQMWNSDNCADCQTGYRSREVNCQVVRAGRMDFISEDHCSSLPVPGRRSACSACSRRPLPRWYTTRWSACSVSCGGGQKRRKVRCYESTGTNTPSNMCDNNFKPLAVASCNTTPCAAVGPRCLDRLTRSQCGQVKQNRLCRHNYYRQSCCLTCRG